MGLFGGGKKTIVGTTVSRVIEDKSLPDSIQSGFIKALFAEEQQPDIPGYVIEEIVGSVGLKAERMYEYASKHYVHGLPSGRFHSAMQGAAEVEAVLARIEGVPVELEYSRIGSPNFLHLGWMKLIAERGYNPQTNEITGLRAQYNTPVYLKDLVVIIPDSLVNDLEDGALEQWGISPKAGFTPERSAKPSMLVDHSPIQVSPVATSPQLLVLYTWQTTTWGIDGAIPENHEASFELVLGGYIEEADYFHVKYRVNGITKYWLYEDDSGVHPTLDAVFKGPTEQGTFFPFAYFRYNKTSELEDKSTDAYKTSKKLVKYLGMDYDTVTEAIHDNPDIDDVEQAMLVMAVPANSQDPLEQRYLFEFFSNWFHASGSQFRTETAAKIAATQIDNSDLNRATIVIQDARFKMALSHDGIFKRRVAGSIGAVGSCNSSTTEKWVNQPYVDEFGSHSFAVKVTTHHYRKQTNNAQYDEISVVGLQMKYHIWGKYHTVGDETDDILLVPIDRSITRYYSIPDRETLYSRSMHYVFNSRQVIKIKWYQTMFFRFIMIVVAVAITIYTGGAAGIQALASAIAAGGAAATAAMWTLLTKIVIGLAISAALKVFVKAVGFEAAFIIALAAMAVGGYMSMDAGSVAGAPWAQELMQLATGLMKAVSANVGDLMGDLAKEASNFTKFMEEQTKTLETAQELLDGNNLLSPFVIFGESPADYFNRTVHSGNIGVVGINAVSSFVDVALTLPKLDDTVGENFYV